MERSPTTFIRSAALRITLLLSMLCPIEVHAAGLALPAPTPTRPELPEPTRAQSPIVGFTDARLRFEAVGGGDGGDASAMTLRLRSGVEIILSQRASALFEIEAVADISREETQSGASRRLGPDLSVLELNRAQISYAFPTVQLIGGRQRIQVADERFVGSAGFRQNEQTYDALRLTANAPLGMTAEATYIWQVNRFNNADAATSRWTGNTSLLNLSAPTPLGSLKAFHYVMDLQDKKAGIKDARASNVTSGISIINSIYLNTIEWEWRGDYAWQRDYGANPFEYRADYSRLQVKANSERFGVVVNLERLGSKGLRGFQFPLGSNHAFQGSADIFVVTPPSGVRDFSLEGIVRFPALGRARNTTIVARHHQFDSDLDGTPLGNEWDVTVSTTISGYRLSIDHARYTALSFANDTIRTWLTVARIF